MSEEGAILYWLIAGTWLATGAWVCWQHCCNEAVQRDIDSLRERERSRSLREFDESKDTE